MDLQETYTLFAPSFLESCIVGDGHFNIEGYVAIAE